MRARVFAAVQVISAMGPPGGARNNVDPRFMSLFNVFEVQFPSSENLSTIYQVRAHTHCARMHVCGCARALACMNTHTASPLPPL